MKVFSIEFKRGVRSRAFKVTILAGFVLAFIQFIKMGLLSGDEMEVLKEHGISTVAAGISNIHNSWLGGELNSFYSSIFWAVFPFLITIPFARSYFVDRKFGRIKNVLTRTNPKDYYISIWLSNFLIAGIASILPLLLSLALHSTTSTWMRPFVETSTFEVGYQSSETMFYLFYNKTALYQLIYFINIFIFAGLLSNIGLVSVIVEERFFVPLFVPFVIWMFTDLMSILYPSFFISLKNYLNPVGGSITLAKSLVLIVILFLSSAIPLWYQYKYKKDF
ncbi:hypothetical protein [Lagierella sp.]|uniref:hypothetical protein n=1 Tax=Lagierella sp. TaxID=2849657 RepID=UPI0026115E13|nr:hypothetical protein [Lagierella sp.]